MTFQIQKENGLLACLLLLFACRAMLASAIVPPWQGPDEPAHFISAKQLPVDAYWASEVPLLRAVLESMGKYRWWEAYGGRTPALPRPEFEYVSSRLSRGNYGQPLYSGLAVLILRTAPTASVEGAYWRLRILSIVLAIATLGWAWAGTRLLFGSTVATGATAIAALHPQFLLAAISVNADALAICLGAVIWWLVACVITGRRVHMSLLLVVVAAVAAVLTKRNVAPLAAVATMIAVGWFLGLTMRRMPRRTAAWVTILLMLGTVVLLSTAVAFETVTTQLRLFWRDGLSVRRLPEGRTLRTALDYARLSIDYVWLIVGWLRFSAPEPWLWIVRTLTVVGFGSAAVLAARSREARRPLAIAGLLVFVQVGIVISWGFLTLSSPQGRYLLPVIAPATALLWLGLTHAVPARFRPYAAPALIALLAVMDVTAFTSVLIPAYLPWE